MYVLNDVRQDVRVLREAATLAEAGHAVTVIGRTGPSSSSDVERELVDGFEIVRVPGSSARYRDWQLLRHAPWRLGRRLIGDVRAALRRMPPDLPAALAGLAKGSLLTPWAVLRFALHLSGRSVSSSDDAIDWLLRWRFVVLAWAQRAAAIAPPADVHHGHDLSGLPAAVEAATRDRARVVYDSHEYFLESRSNARRPRWARMILGRMERNLARRADALVTVNESLATELSRRLRPRRTVVVYNAPPRWKPGRKAADPLRPAAGIPSGTPVALYHGAFTAHRGIEQLAAAILEPGLESAHAVLLGYGELHDELVAQAADDRYGGRLHVLDAVAPEDLPAWVAPADVGIVAIQASTLNHRLSTPNKLFECLAVGVPVVASDFPEMRRIVHDPLGSLGELCDPSSPADLARAIRAILDLSPDARAELRARCLKASHERWNWETEGGRLVALYERLAAGD